MSTYWYFQCRDHPPPRGSDEFTQPTDDADDQRRIALAADRPLDHSWWDGPQGTHSERNARIFLEAHPRCHLEAVSEHGDQRPVPSPVQTESADEVVARLMWDSECTDEWTWAYLTERADRREGDYAEIRDMYLRMVAVARAALEQHHTPSREQCRSIVQVAEGSTFRARQHGDPQERFWFLAAGMGVVSLDAIMAHANSIDPSSIRDVTPPPATPKEGDR